MNVIREIGKINEEELRLGIKPEASWHMEYKDSKYIYVGGLDEDLTEGDILTVFSQFGTITDINLIKDLETEKSRGFAFLAYEDQRSTILAVDNFNGARLLDRVLQVDHVKNYKFPKVPEELIDYDQNEEPQKIEKSKKRRKKHSKKD